MISTFKSKALALYWNKADASKLPAASVPRIRILLQSLNAATMPEDMNLPGFHFHQLSGRSVSRFSVRVTANWRLTFAWEPPNAVKVDLEDYH
ncbi:MAG: type II toxin-antitoxin system RelE/ParE family toxin [Janthinobacterium lividum]